MCLKFREFDFKTKLLKTTEIPLFVRYPISHKQGYLEVNKKFC